MLRRHCLSLLLLLLGSPVLGAWAQEPDASARTEATVPAYAAERNLIESILGTVVGVIREATLQEPAPGVSDRLRAMALQLNEATETYSAPRDATYTTTYDADTLDALEDLLAAVREQIRTLYEDVVDDDPRTGDRLEAIDESLTEAMGMLRRMARTASNENRHRHDHHPGHVRLHTHDAEQLPERTWKDDEWTDDEWATDEDAWEHDDDDETWKIRTDIRVKNVDRRVVRDERRSWRDAEDRDAARDHRWDRPFDRFSHADAFVGDLSYRWPYRETALYRPIPAVRYNRVDGLVLGIGQPPLDWYDRDRATLYGQIGYAFGLERWRYELGVEVHPLRDRRDDAFGLKLGAAYRRNTTTEDHWKLSWAENSLAAFLFEDDYFDYYEAEGWTVYATQRLTRYAQVSAGYRSEVHRSLDVNTGWSLFGGGHNTFRMNPPVAPDSSRLNAVTLAFEGGTVRDFHRLPRGAAFRFEAELADGFDGDFAYNRYLGDVRFYLPLSRFSSLGLRVRGGYADEATPIHKQFTLGGVGSVRGYMQNQFFGTRMLLANAELAVANVDLLEDLFDDVQLYGLFDAGWTNGYAGTNTLDLGDVFPSAGLGIGLDDRDLRLEIAWPLRDIGDNGLAPSFLISLSPTF